MVHSARRKGKGRSRILYWFRTPPGVRVGRGPLDQEAIRTLEAANPDVEFDWTRILKGQPGPETKAPERRDPDRRERRDQYRGRERRSAVAADSDAAAIEIAGATPSSGDAAIGRKTSLPETARTSLISTAPDVIEPLDEPIRPATAAEARLGSHGVARLRARFSEMLARIDERVPEPERQAELKSVAERLNPDGWVTDDEVSAGLESYESTFAVLRGAIGPAPRSSRD